MLPLEGGRGGYGPGHIPDILNRGDFSHCLLARTHGSLCAGRLLISAKGQKDEGRP
jgi:hypothetical protein